MREGWIFDIGEMCLLRNGDLVWWPKEGVSLGVMAAC